MALRWLLSIILCSSALTGWGRPWDADSLATIFAGRQLEPVEGVWQIHDDGAMLLIAKESASTFSIILLDSPLLDAPTGVAIGRAVATADADRYDATLERGAITDSKLRSTRLVLSVTTDGMLRFAPYSTGVKLNLRRWVPYLFRIVESNNTRPAGLMGARRIFPIAPDSYKPCL
ncbi:MAG: hypothetical protein K2N16_07820 [Muribaculaceae bacterium]|nr:hypothetical protein [Muribaculaceae bacterium]